MSSSEKTLKENNQGDGGGTPKEGSDHIPAFVPDDKNQLGDEKSEQESNCAVIHPNNRSGGRVSDARDSQGSTVDDEGLEDRIAAAAIVISLDGEEMHPKDIQQGIMKEKEVAAAVENPENLKIHREDEEEKCEIEAPTESVVELSSDLIVANDSPSSEPAPAQSSSTTIPMDPISSQPGAFRVAGLDGEASELDSLVIEEESVAPTVETTSSKKLVEAWKVGPEQDTSDDVEAQVQQRLAEVLRNAPVAQARVEDPNVP